MPNSLAHRIMAISMALSMLLSSTGFSVDMHYCQDQLMSIGLFGKAKSCHDRQAASPCHRSKTCSHHDDTSGQADKDNCCQNKTMVVKKMDIDAIGPQLATFQDLCFPFVVAFVRVLVFDCDAQIDYQPYTQYKPPARPHRDMQVLYQTFLI